MAKEASSKAWGIRKGLSRSKVLLSMRAPGCYQVLVNYLFAIRQKGMGTGDFSYTSLPWGNRTAASETCVQTEKTARIVTKGKLILTLWTFGSTNGQILLCQFLGRVL